jgi:hypothetical protein
MGRYPVLILVSLISFACAVEEAPRPEGDPHSDLACTQCHQGGLADRSLAAVPRSACTGSGCHRDAIPGEVTLATVRFEHRSHGSTETLSLGCAGCHTHGSGDEPLSAGPETCGLCHHDELSGAQGEDCRLCHTAPTHAGYTGQDVAIPHQGLPWIEGGCLRCHYQVTTPVHEVSRDRCGACHEDLESVTRSGIGEDLHPLHSGLSCASCHEADNHRIEAMSSAVNLVCSQCHTTEHSVEIEATGLDGSCSDCHHRVHEGPQALLLGLASTSVAAAPSSHFMDGLTCRSCHVIERASNGTRTRGSAQACVGCHRAEYATVLDWWQQGIADRLELVSSYVGLAERAVASRGDDDPAAAAASGGRRSLTLVAQGRGEHNITLAHRLFEEAVASAQEAYRLSGQQAPPAPHLGRLPRQGICAYCHYELEQLAITEAMDDAFHRDVMLGR